MRTVSSAHTTAWQSGDYTGANRPMARATIQIMQLNTTSSSNAIDVYSHYLFGQPSRPLELPNLKSVSYDRHIDTDVATCRIELYNTEPLPLGTAVTADDFGNYIFEQPGYYTMNRGLNTYTNRWHHATNAWQRMIAPDRLIRTYEGYGFDVSVGPDFDTHMNQSGVWIVDDVSYDDRGLIIIECRDAARLLTDQILFPPVVPKARYPMFMTSLYDAPNTGGPASGTTWLTPTYDTDSSLAHGGPDLLEFGHYPHHLFDDDPSTYWLSVGYGDPDASYAYEWVQGTFASQTVNGVSVTTRGGPYIVYVSLWTTYNPSNPGSPVAARWGGGANVPYNSTATATPNGANIRYVQSFTAAANTTTYFKLADSILGTTKVRFTFRHLYNSRQADPGYPNNTYRAAAVAAQVSGNLTLNPSVGTHKEGDYGDYSEIVKRLLAYGGFHWPKDSALAFQTKTDGTRVSMMPANDDAFLGSGNLWADMMFSGAAGLPQTALGPTVWDKKTIMDGISYVREIVGFNFFVDETGAAVFRMPNIFRIGNYKAFDGTVPSIVTPPSLSTFSDDFARADNALVGNGWIQSGGDFYIDTQRAITKDDVSYMGQNFGHKEQTVQADVKSPDNMKPAVYLWSNSSSQGEGGYSLVLTSQATGTNLELRRNGTTVTSDHVGAISTAVGNVYHTLMLGVSINATGNVFVKGYFDGVLTLTYNEPSSSAPTGTWSGVGNAGAAGGNGISVDNFAIQELAPIDTSSGGYYQAGESNLVVLDENEHILSLKVQLSSRSLRDRVFVSNASGQVGATAAGHTGDQGPFDARLRRVGGWTDQHFSNNLECQVMADLISLRMLFTYRTDKVVIPGYSKIQLDDQVRIIEGTTSEDFIHYVRGLSSSWDVETGEWTYSLDTHWLGEAPFTSWIFDPSDLSDETQAFLQANGSI